MIRRRLHLMPNRAEIGQLVRLIYAHRLEPKDQLVTTAATFIEGVRVRVNFRDGSTTVRIEKG
jgi:hypothetical protein